MKLEPRRCSHDVLPTDHCQFCDGLIDMSAPVPAADPAPKFCDDCGHIDTLHDPHCLYREHINAPECRCRGFRAADPAPKWNGLCPAGKHGLDYASQKCDLCPVDPAPERRMSGATTERMTDEEFDKSERVLVNYVRGAGKHDVDRVIDEARRARAREVELAAEIAHVKNVADRACKFHVENNARLRDELAAAIQRAERAEVAQVEHSKTCDSELLAEALEEARDELECHDSCNRCGYVVEKSDAALARVPKP